MLPFMNEDSKEDKPEEGQNEYLNDSAEMPDSADNVADKQDKQPQPDQQDYLTVASRDNKIKRGTIVLVILFAVGLLFVLLMIKKSSPSPALGLTNEESRIESAIAQLTGLKLGIGDRIDQIVKRFNQFSDVKKLQVEQLQKNPFVRERYYPASGLSSGSEAGTEALNSELARQAESMQLFSIMHSDNGNCCMIDDKLLYEGDKIGGFEVCRISDFSVELCTDGMKFVLRIPSEF
jgi:hypothetical protein